MARHGSDSPARVTPRRRKPQGIPTRHDLGRNGTRAVWIICWTDSVSGGRNRFADLPLFRQHSKALIDPHTA